jgi:hypothetical protein
MKKLLLLSLLFLSFTAYSQIPNADFENWITDSLGRINPADWSCSNTSSSYSSVSVIQDAGHTGSYSAKFTSHLSSGSLIAKGGFLYLNDYPYSNPTRPASLQGFWKTNNPGNNHDILNINTYFYNASGTTIGSALSQTPTASSVSNWTAFTSTISYTSSDPVTKYSIQIDWNANSSQVTGYAFVDGLTFNIPTGTNELDNSSDVYLYKNQSSKYFLNFTQKTSTPVHVELVDMTGRLVSVVCSSARPIGENSIPIEDALLSKGIYICRYSSGEIAMSFKLIIE